MSETKTEVWRVIADLTSDRYRAVGPWRDSEDEAGLDAEHGSMRGALPETPVDQWRAGIADSIRKLRRLADKPRDLWHPAYFSALDEAVNVLEAMLARGSYPSTEVLMGDETYVVSRG